MNTILAIGEMGLKNLNQSLTKEEVEPDIRQLSALCLLAIAQANDDALDEVCDQLFGFQPVGGPIALNSLPKSLLQKGASGFHKFKSYSRRP